jgi:hypothetical protein
MKNIQKLVFLVIIVAFISCEKEESIDNIEQSTLLTPMERAISLFGDLEETDPADATFNILGQSANDPVQTAYTPLNGNINFLGDTNLINVNLGDVMFNNVRVQASKNYNKHYEINEMQQEATDVSNIFGQSVNVRNINCTGSALCNFNFNINMIHKFKNTSLVGRIDQFTVNRNNGFTLKWDNSTIASDEMIGVVIFETGTPSNSVVGSTVTTFSKLIPSSDNQVVISGSDLSVFPSKAGLGILLIKGKSYTNTLPNSKKVRVTAADIVSFVTNLDQ